MASCRLDSPVPAYCVASNVGASYRLRSSPRYIARWNGMIRSLASDDGSSGNKRQAGERLWRKELQQGEGTAVSVESLIEEDVRRLAEAQNPQNVSLYGERNDAEKRQTQPQKLGFVASLVEKLLIADFFFILFILAWFVAGLVEKAAFDTFSLIDVWLLLWPLVFQPALGVFMAAAIFTALSKALSKGGKV